MKKSRKRKLYLLSAVSTAGVAFLIYLLGVPNPNVILITVTVFFTFLGGFLPGAVCAAVIIAYSLLFFSEPGRLFQFSAINLQKIIVIVIFVPVLVIIVGILKKSADVKSRKLEFMNGELERLASMDYLTGIPNRRTFDAALVNMYRDCAERHSLISCALADIDFFKQYNDSNSHIAGDECLRKIARAIEDETHRTNCFAARYGGEEFVILFPDADAHTAIEAGSRIAKAIEALHISHLCSEISPYVTVSIGISCHAAGREEDAMALVADADKALYQAKNNGRNRIEVIGEKKV